MPISTVENIDCMVGMRDTPDNYYSLAICDPPYGIGNRLYSGGRGNQIGRVSSALYKGKQWDKVPTNDYFRELRRMSKDQIIWGGNYFDLPPTRCFIIWDKVQPLKTFSFGEFGWTSFDSVAKLFRFAYTNYCEGETNPTKKIHPTQKPVALYKWLLTNYAKKGDTILDTHLGSGSSRIAAYDLGFDFTGFELDFDYYEAQEKRFANHLKQPTLFESLKPQPAQEVLFAEQE